MVCCCLVGSYMFTVCLPFLPEAAPVVLVPPCRMQALLKSGHSPTLIQLLCTLPFEYFSSPRWARVAGLREGVLGSCQPCVRGGTTVVIDLYSAYVYTHVAAGHSTHYGILIVIHKKLA